MSVCRGERSMAGKLCLVICSLGLMNLVTATLVKSYAAGSSPIGSTLEVHGVSTFYHGLPGSEESIERRDTLHHGHEHTQKTVPSDSKPTHSPQSEQSKPKTGKWCSFVRSRVVTYVDFCKTEKYVIRSQQLCPLGTPDCQKIMYRLAQKPIYAVKRKFVTSLEWKCCSGYTGSNCEYADPNAIHIHLEHKSSSEEIHEPPKSTEVTEIIKAVESQEILLEDIQNDIHLATNHLLDLQNALGNNGTIALNESHNHSEIDDHLLREVFLPYVENFLKAHFSPVWNSFNKSLQNLNSMVKNLSENVETNRKRLDIFLENTVPKKDLYELGTKFESKIQENVDKLEQLKQGIDKHFHTQQIVIHHNFTMIKADADVKFKRNLKMQQSQYSHMNFSIAELRRGQEQMQDDLLDLAQNITLLCSPKEESMSITSHKINETLVEYDKQINDLLTETDVAFENISILEKWVKELRTEFKKNSDKVQIQFMEKSLIMEENKDFIQRQLMELNYTIASIQESSDELFRDCDCHKMNLDILALEEIQRNFSNQFRDVLYGIEDVKQKEGSSKTSLQNSVEDLSLALQLNRQSLTAQQEQGRNLMRITSQLQTQTRNFTDDVKLLRLDNNQIHNHIKHLNSSFSSLLEDARRHEKILEALLGEEVLELYFEDNPEALHMSIEQIYEVLNNTLDKLEKQQLTTDSLIDRLHFLEMQSQNHNSPDSSTIFNVEQHTEGKTYYGPFQHGNLAHMEPNQEALRNEDESEYSDIMILKRDIEHLSVKMNKLESYFANGHYYTNDTIVDTLKPLNISITSMKIDIANLSELYGRHIDTFHKIFGNYEALISSNVTLNIAKVHSLIDKKMKKKLRGEESQTRKLGKKKIEEQWQSDETTILNQDFPVAFSVGFSKGAKGVNIIRFNDIILNYGNAFSPEDGHFIAPYSGVYAFAITVDFGVGNALGHLVCNGQQRLVLHNSSTQPAESLKHQFTVVGLKKGERVWFELLQGSIKENSLGTSLAGYLVFKT
ncbi:multimerin-2 [Mixophyes fleayi]|uniref:multimerin-2 n=1 Tax=Mixophyes fleayi TaxID=3061075 RepID=UPI003F4DAA34